MGKKWTLLLTWLKKIGGKIVQETINSYNVLDQKHSQTHISNYKLNSKYINLKYPVGKVNMHF